MSNKADDKSDGAGDKRKPAESAGGFEPSKKPKAPEKPKEAEAKKAEANLPALTTHERLVCTSCRVLPCACGSPPMRPEAKQAEPRKLDLTSARKPTIGATLFKAAGASSSSSAGSSVSAEFTQARVRPVHSLAEGHGSCVRSTTASYVTQLVYFRDKKGADWAVGCWVGNVNGDAIRPAQVYVLNRNVYDQVVALINAGTAFTLTHLTVARELASTLDRGAAYSVYTRRLTSDPNATVFETTNRTTVVVSGDDKINPAIPAPPLVEPMPLLDVVNAFEDTPEGDKDKKTKKIPDPVSLMGAVVAKYTTKFTSPSKWSPGGRFFNFKVIFHGWTRPGDAAKSELSVVCFGSDFPALQEGVPYVFHNVIVNTVHTPAGPTASSVSFTARTVIAAADLSTLPFEFAEQLALLNDRRATLPSLEAAACASIDRANPYNNENGLAFALLQILTIFGGADIEDHIKQECQNYTCEKNHTKVALTLTQKNSTTALQATKNCGKCGVPMKLLFSVDVEVCDAPNAPLRANERSQCDAIVYDEAFCTLVGMSALEWLYWAPSPSPATDKQAQRVRALQVVKQQSHTLGFRVAGQEDATNGATVLAITRVSRG